MIFTRCKKWLPGIVALLLMLGLCRLGFWQLDRAAQKQHMIDRFERRSEQSPLNLHEILTLGKDITDYPLVLTGRFLNEHHFLLDNRILNARAGYNVLTPFLVDGMIVLVDRGWLPANQERIHLPPIPPGTRRHITGTVYVPNERTFTLLDDDYTQPSFPMLIQKIDLEESASLFNAPLLPFLLRQDAREASPLLRDIPVSHLDPGKNVGYAFQWFAMAIAVLVLAIIVGYRHLKNTVATSIEGQA